MGLSTQWLCVFIAIFSAGTQCAAQCTLSEVNQMFACITQHNAQFFAAFDGSGPACDRSVITQPLCQSFGVIVTCISAQGLPSDKCLPNAAGQINHRLLIPCKVEDLFAVCTDVPNILASSCGALGLSLPVILFSLSVVFGSMMLTGRL